MVFMMVLLESQCTLPEFGRQTVNRDQVPDFLLPKATDETYCNELTAETVNLGRAAVPQASTKRTVAAGYRKG